MRSLAAALGMIATTAVAAHADVPASEGAAEAHVDATATAGADAGADGIDVSGGGHARAFLGDPDGDAVNIGLTADLDVHRIPWLDARRDLAASPYSVGTAAFVIGGAWPADQMVHFRGVVTVGWPMDMWIGETLQDGTRRKIGGGHARALRNCWAPGDDGESTCLSWFGGGATEIHDDTYAYATIAIEFLPLEGLRLGPLRADVVLGETSVERGRLDASPGETPGFHVTALRWEVALRGHVGPVALALGSRRDPYAAADSSLSLEDRVSLDAGWTSHDTRWAASVYAARDRWWMAPDPAMTVADTAGVELAVQRRVLGIGVTLRAAVGRSFFPALDGSLPVTPGLGARVGLELSRGVAFTRPRSGASRVP